MQLTIVDFTICSGVTTIIVDVAVGIASFADRVQLSIVSGTSDLSGAGYDCELRCHDCSAERNKILDVEGEMRRAQSNTRN